MTDTPDPTAAARALLAKMTPGEWRVGPHSAADTSQVDIEASEPTDEPDAITITWPAEYLLPANAASIVFCTNAMRFAFSEEGLQAIAAEVVGEVNGKRVAAVRVARSLLTLLASEGLKP